MDDDLLVCIINFELYINLLFGHLISVNFDNSYKNYGHVNNYIIIDNSLRLVSFAYLSTWTKSECILCNIIYSLRY
jgi:hypothetical protein